MYEVLVILVGSDSGKRTWINLEFGWDEFYAISISWLKDRHTNVDTNCFVYMDVSIGFNNSNKDCWCLV